MDILVTMKNKIIAFRTILFGLTALFLAHPITSFALGNPSEVTILRFREVTSDIYRGARPETTGMEQLKAFGIRTDLNIDNDHKSIAQEQSDAARLGINFISKPMSGFWAPTDRKVNAILEILNDPSLYPIYVHCKHGQDRTGLIMGLYRVRTEGWAPAAAYQEMLDIGFHQTLIFLNHFFETRTGFED